MIYYFVLSALLTVHFFLFGEESFRLPVGINLGGSTYFDVAPPFVDLKMSSGEWITFTASGASPWDTEKLDKIERDEKGYPLEIPAKIRNGPPQAVRFLINNQKAGDYRLLYEGEGKFGFAVDHTIKNGEIIIHLTGDGENKWINLESSKRGNPIRNIRILPVTISNGAHPPLFDPLYLAGLRPFHCLRFMDWMATNNSKQETWDTRSLPDYHTQGSEKGIAIEYAIALCNEVKADAWLCVPHKADDNYIIQFATLVRDTLDPNLKVYIEYSNEVWNWGFSQSRYVLENASGAKDEYVRDSLIKINPAASDHPEKDAYMMQRVFRIWESVFEGLHRKRLVRVATAQHYWPDNTRRILEYLFKKEGNGNPLNSKAVETSLGRGCDAVAPAGYFSYNEKDQETWLKISPELVTTSLILGAVDKNYAESARYTEENGQYAKQFGVDYLVYEGGQHIVPLEWGKESPTNNAIWNVQIAPQIYDIYMKMFRTHVSPKVDCKLFCAYSYIGPRRSVWGSWGHLEKLEQLKTPSEIKISAPKYKALLEANSPK